MELKVEGLLSLMAKLSYLGGNANETVGAGISKGVQKIKSDAKRFCPADTGRLRNSITTEKLSETAYAVGTNVEYAPFVEYGTGQRGNPEVAHTTSVIGTYPHPFLLPAIVANENYVIKSCQLELLKAIKGAMNRR